MTNKQAYAGLLERLVAEATLLDQLACTLTKGKSQVSQAGDACREAAEAISSLLNALAMAREALADERVGTIYNDDPDWYRMVDEAVAAIDAALNSDAPLSTGDAL